MTREPPRASSRPRLGVPVLLAFAPAVGEAPYGELLPADANGIMLPRGFTAREIARAGQPVAGTDYVWHRFPDGGATFALPDSGWIYVSNSELDGDLGGVGAIRFAPDGSIADAYSICSGTSRNCSGGVTPWRTWLTCEEVDDGQVWECDPEGERPAVVRPAMGSFTHEAVAADPVTRTLFLTEDDPNGRLYRFTPTQWGDLADGRARGRRDAPTTASSRGSRPTRAAATTYAGGEGIAYYDGRVVFTTKSDDRIRVVRHRDACDARPLRARPAAGDRRTRQHRVRHERRPVRVRGRPSEQDLVFFGADGARTQVLRLDASHEGSELAGVALDPSGTRLYFSSQRGGGGAGRHVRGHRPVPAARRCRRRRRRRATSTSSGASTPTTRPGRPDDTGGASGDDDSAAARDRRRRAASQSSRSAGWRGCAPPGYAHRSDALPRTVARRAAQPRSTTCTACDLYKDATQAVFGEGPGRRGARCSWAKCPATRRISPATRSSGPRARSSTTRSTTSASTARRSTSPTR